MKTVVLGLFDQMENAERVLAQLADAPLDLDSVQVLHRDTGIQRRLSEQAGILPRRAMRTGLVTGGLLGAALGLAAGWAPAGEAALLAGPGPLLTLAGGALLGALAGGAGGAMAETSRIPDAHARVALEAVAAGAVMVFVQTENLPTARAIGNLFRDGGSRVLTDDPPAQATAADDPRTDFRPAPAPAEPAEPGLDATIPNAHAPFAPPWRREGADPVAPEARSSGSEPTQAGGPLFPSAEPPSETAAQTATQTGTQTIRHGETVTAVDRSSRELMPRDLPGPKTPAFTVDRSPVEPAGDGQRSALAPAAPASASAAVSPLPALAAIGLSKRVLGLLRKAGLEDTQALKAAAETAALRGLPGIGPAAAAEIEASLARLAGAPARPLAERHPTPDPRSASPARPKPAPPASDPVEQAAQALLRELFGGS